MGLDQYLYMNIYLGKDCAIKEKIINEFQYEPTKIVFEVGYWRKCWGIHDWFVKNCSFNDNGDSVSVTFKQLLKLKEENPSEVEYLNLIKTIKIIDKIIKFQTLNKLDDKKYYISYTYSANW
jgi:hypothetical protein